MTCFRDSGFCSVLPKDLLVCFCRQLTWLSSNSKLSPPWWAAAEIKVQFCFVFFFKTLPGLLGVCPVLVYFQDHPEI